MSSQPENPQYDDRQYDSRYGDPLDDAHGTGDRYGRDDEPYAEEPGGPPYRAIAMVLLAAVVLAIGVGLVQLFGGDDEEAVTAVEETVRVEPDGQSSGEQVGSGQDTRGQVGADGQPAAPDAAVQSPAAPVDGGQDPQPDEQGQAPAGSAPAVTAVPVQIYNNSTITGLAAQTGERLRESGFAVGDVANMPSDRGVVAESTVYFGTGPGEQEAAQAIAAQLGITAQPRPADMVTATPGVIVIVTQDLNR